MMTSLSKIYANRANARLSTGPKTTIGRSRSSQNARRHGLSTSVLLDPVLAQEVKTLALQLAQGIDTFGSVEAAYCIAEAEIDLKRIRRIKDDILQRLNGKQHPVTAARCDAPNSEFPVNEVSEAGALDVMEEILLIDRYERRALARRKSAIRQFTRELPNDSEPPSKIGKTKPKTSTVSMAARTSASVSAHSHFVHLQAGCSKIEYTHQVLVVFSKKARWRYPRGLRFFFDMLFRAFGAPRRNIVHPPITAVART